MAKIGFTLSSEEFSAPDLIAHGEMAENAGFDFCMLSDHYHPWLDTEGQSPFVWSVLGGLSQVTQRLVFGTGVTCPIMRYHPALIAQASATVASLLENRFILGLGTGENLNEHIIGEGWPTIDIRQAMLREAVDIIRTLWNGQNESYYGAFYTVEDARIYTLPKMLPPIFIAAGGPVSAALAGNIGDGLIVTSPQKKAIDAFRSAGGKGKPIIAQMSVCYAASLEEASETVLRMWPQIALGGQLNQELRLPLYFKQATQTIGTAHLLPELPLGPEPHSFIDQAQKYLDAGVTHLYFHQIGPNQASFINFFNREIKSHLV